MPCELCGRNNCTRSFHSLEEQSSFDDQADAVKERLRNLIIKQLDHAEYIEQDGEVWIKLIDAIKIVEQQD